MALSDFSLSSVTDDQISAARSWLLAELATHIPNTDFSRGAIYGSVILPLTTVLAAISNAIDAVRNSHDITRMLSGAVDDDELAAFLQNYKLVRRPATAATGDIYLVLSSNNTIVIPKGFTFKTSDNLSFSTTEAVTGVSGTPGPGQQRFEPFGTKWRLTLPAMADFTGTAGNIPAGTQLTPVDPPPAFVSSMAATTFRGGAAAETVQSLAHRLLTGIAAGTFSSPTQLLALLHSAAANRLVDDGFANIRGVSVVGSGAPEMMRDKRGLFPVSLGGRCDIYCKSSDAPSLVYKQYTASLIGRTPVAGDGIWQFSIRRDDAPGFYRVYKITRPGESNEYEISGDNRNFDLTDDGRYLPDITSAYEAVYSPFQTATISFIDTDTIVEDSDIGVRTKVYDVYILAMPLLADIQQFLSNNFIRPPGLDVLVRAPVPMSVSVSITVSAALTSEQITVVKDAVYELIATRPIGHNLSQSEVAGAVSSVLPSTIRVVSVILSGTVRAITGSNVNVSVNNEGVLEIPNRPEDGITSRTVMLLTQPNLITVS